MQRQGLEWLYRLVQNPGRLAKRYLGGAPRLIELLLRGQFILRSAGTASQLSIPPFPARPD
jgi:UDP-N-acetyl-D-mannosaminuronic acid transferase (WecB/TagA/CpsF family)